MSLVLFRDLKPSAPGVPSAENPNARNYFLLQNEVADSSGKFQGKSFVFVQDSPSRAPLVLMNSS